MRFITRAITHDREFKQAMLTLGEQYTARVPLPLSASGLSDGALEAFLTEAVRTAHATSLRPRLVLVREEREGRALASLLSEEGEEAYYYPSRDFVFSNITASHDTERERLSVLCRLLTGASITVVTTPYAALQRTLPPASLARRALSLRVGDEISPSLLAEQLVRMGFAPVSLVEGVGQFAHRGGIFDLYAAGESAPVRLEFFGDEIDRLAYFDPISQRVTASADAVSLVPARESLWDGETRAAMTAAHKALLSRATGETRAHLAAELSLLEGDGDIPFADRYFALLYPEMTTLLSFFEGERTAVFVLGDSLSSEATGTRLAQLCEEGTAVVSDGFLDKKYNAFCATEGDLALFLTKHIPVYLTGFGNSYSGKLSGLFGFRSRRTVSYFGKEALLADDVATLRNGYYRVLVLTESAAEADAVAELLEARDFPVKRISPDSDEGYECLDDAVGVTFGAYPSGFELLVPKIALLSTAPDEGVKHRRARARRRRAPRPAGQRILSYADLSVGDYVVHAVHGIGVFEGMQQIRQDGVTRDYITIRYAGADSLLLPAERLEMIAKYIGAGAEEGTVRISRLGGGDWQRQKSRANGADCKATEVRIDE